MNSRIEKWLQQVEMSLQSDVTMQQHKGEEVGRKAAAEEKEGGFQFSCTAGGPLGMEVRVEAQSIINALIAGESPVATEPPRLLSPDWSGDLDIQSAASSIVDHLMNKPLDISLAVEEEQQHVTDPRVAMEMRHRKIQEKRKAREYAQSVAAKEKVDRREARRRAEREVMLLERERKAKEKADEALVQLEVNRLRKQMQEERARQQLYNDAVVTTQHHRDTLDKKTAALVNEAEENVHQTERRAEKPAKKRAKSSKHTRGTTTTENTSERTLLPPSPPPLAKRRHRGQDGQRRHKDAQYETCDKPTSSTASVAPSLPSASSASSLARMERVTAHEQRQRLKVMRRSFTHWHRRLVHLRVAGGRAAATWDWKAMLRTWREWKMATEEKRSEKVTDATIAVQHELRLASAAALHHKRQQLRLCFGRWRRWCREEVSRRTITQEAESRKEKMSTLLQAVRRKGEKQPHPQQSAPPIPPSNPKQKHTAPDVNLITSKIVRQELEKILVDSRMRLAREAPPPTEGDVPVASTVATNAGNLKVAKGRLNPTRRTKSAAAAVDGRGSGVAGKASDAQESALLQPPSDAVSEGGPSCVHLEADEPTSRVRTQAEHQTHTEAETVIPLSTTGQKHDNLSAAQTDTTGSSSHPAMVEKIPSRKPPTKPVSLSGMERRTEEIAKRKEERKRRQKQVEEEELSRRTEEEEKKAREAREVKEALLRKKREEREQAKQKELDRQKLIEHSREMNEKACLHYRTLQRRRCVKHWKQFVLMVRRMASEADDYHQATVYKRHFVPWLRVFEDRVEAMLMKASDFHRIHLMKRAFHGLSEHLHCVQDLNRAAINFNKHHLLRLHLKAWLLYVTEEKLGMWEKERTAKNYHSRVLTEKAFRSWTLFVPLSKHERERERRRTELRLKVASWLPDYQAA